jgi:hypothetical protein
MNAPDTHLYRFAPLDRTGWILGLSGVQCALVAVTILAATTAAQLGAPPAAMAVIVTVGLTISFARWSGTSLHEWLPVATRHSTASVTGSLRWHRPLGCPGIPVDLPGFLAGTRVRDAGTIDWHDTTCRLGTVEDHRGQIVAGTLRVRGAGFALAEPAEQDRRLAQWGSALAGTCREQTAVVAVRVTEWSAPGHSDDHTRYARDHRATNADAAAIDAYEDLLAHAPPPATHDVLVTVAVDVRRARRSRPHADRHTTALEVLADELRRLAARLDTAGHHAAPLNAADLATVLRIRCDPTARDRLSTRGRSLAELAGLAIPVDAAPLATATEWNHTRVDGAVHRSYWISDWPRLDVPAAWLEPLLLHPGGARTLAVHYEPVPPSRSRRAIDRAATRLATDEEQRSRSGFRVGARHHRSRRAVEEREAELVAGYAEFEYVGVLTVTAATLEDLETNCLDYEQVAAQAGIDLRALHGRHHHALACSLPAAAGLRPRLTW